MTITVLDPLALRVAHRYLSGLRTIGPLVTADALAQVDVAVREALAAVQTAATDLEAALVVARDRLVGSVSAGDREEALREVQLAGERLQGAHAALVAELRWAEAELERIEAASDVVLDSRGSMAPTVAREYQRRGEGLVPVDGEDDDGEAGAVHGE